MYAKTAVCIKSWKLMLSVAGVSAAMWLLVSNPTERMTGLDLAIAHHVVICNLDETLIFPEYTRARC